MRVSTLITTPERALRALIIILRGRNVCPKFLWEWTEVCFVMLVILVIYGIIHAFSGMVKVKSGMLELYEILNSFCIWVNRLIAVIQCRNLEDILYTICMFRK